MPTLIVSPTDLENMVLAIYRDLRIPCCGKLTYSALVKEWSRTRLRNGDLAFGIRQLICEDAIKPDHAHEDQVLQLTQQGDQRVADLSRHSLGNWIWRLRMKLLPLLRGKNAAIAVASPKRRLLDRASPP